MAWSLPKLSTDHYPDSDHWHVVQSGQWKQAVQAYSSAVSFVDGLVGEVLEALSHTPYADNTLVVVLSDNGYHLGAKQRWRKMTLWEEATRVPLVIKHSDRLKPARVYEAVSLIDVYPTLLELTGLSGPGHAMDGVSLVPAMSGNERPGGRFAMQAWGGAVALRDRRYRYISYRAGGEELYDHRSDPMEHTNLLASPGTRAQYAEVTSRFNRIIHRYHPGN